MLHKVNELLPIKIIVSNAAGQRITTASPLCRIINNSLNEYWNGYEWNIVPINLAMTHADSGVYIYDKFMPTEIGRYTIYTDEFMFGIHDMFNVDVYSPNDAGLVCNINQLFTFTLSITDTEGKFISGASPIIQITDEDGNYWNGLEWSATTTSLSMFETNDGIYKYDFVPDKAGEFNVSCVEVENNVEKNYVLAVIDGEIGEVGDIPILVNSNTLIGPNGGDSLIVDLSGVPFGGVTVTAYDLERKITTKVISSSDGRWVMHLRPGRYVFMFEKEDYVTISMERVIA